LKNKYTLMCRGAETKWSQIAYDTTLLALAHHVTRDPDISLALARRMTEIFAGRGPDTGMLDNKLYTRGSVSRYGTMWRPLPYCRTPVYVTYIGALAANAEQGMIDCLLVALLLRRDSQDKFALLPF
jgi:hypothetical protein